jgi:hypothetical protein
MTAKVSASTLLGAAAEHYVMSQLLRRNMIAALAPAGVPDADIIVSDRVGSALAAIQVKARREIGSDGGWHMSIKHETMSRPLLFYCFVDFGRELSDATRCWIIPSETVSQVLTLTHRAWLVAPGKNGRAHRDHEMRRLLPDYSRYGAMGYAAGWMDLYREAWELIGTQAEPQAGFSMPK